MIAFMIEMNLSEIEKSNEDTKKRLSPLGKILMAEDKCQLDPEMNKALHYHVFSIH